MSLTFEEAMALVRKCYESSDNKCGCIWISSEDLTNRFRFGNCTTACASVHECKMLVNSIPNNGDVS